MKTTTIPTSPNFLKIFETIQQITSSPSYKIAIQAMKQFDQSLKQFATSAEYQKIFQSISKFQNFNNSLLKSLTPLLNNATFWQAVSQLSSDDLQTLYIEYQHSKSITITSESDILKSDTIDNNIVKKIIDSIGEHISKEELTTFIGWILIIYFGMLAHLDSSIAHQDAVQAHQDAIQAHEDAVQNHLDSIANNNSPNSANVDTKK